MDAATAIALRVAGEQSPLTLDIEVGDFAGQGRISSAPAQTDEAFTGPGFRPDGTAREIRVEGKLKSPLTLIYGKGGSRGRSAVIARYDRSEGWYPIAVGNPGTSVTVQRRQFSPHTVGWIDPRDMVVDLAAAAGRWATGRTTAPICSGSPGWADLLKPQSDVLLTCIQNRRLKDGRPGLELKVKNNRGFTQQLFVPPGAVYADVEGQREHVRKLIRTLTRAGDVVLLPPGGELRIGFAQPASDDRTFELAPRMTQLTLITDLISYVAMLERENPSSTAIFPILVESLSCATDLVDQAVPKSTEDVLDLLVTINNCLLTPLQDPRLAVELAQRTVAVDENVPLHIVKSDRRFAGAVESRAGRFTHAAAAGRLLTAAQLATVAVQIFESNVEQLAPEVANQDPRIVRLDVSAPRCSLPVIARDLKVKPGAELRYCRNGWARFYYPQVPGDTDQIVQASDGRWRKVTGIPTTLCRLGSIAAEIPAPIRSGIFSCGPGEPYPIPTSKKNGPSNPRGWVISTDGVGPLKIGMSAYDGQLTGHVVQAVDNPCNITWTTTGFGIGPGDQFALTDDWRHNDEDDLDAVIVFDPAFRTKSGLRVGDTLAEVQRRLAGQLRNQQVLLNGERMSMPAVGGDGARVVFKIDNGRVSWIGVAKSSANLNTLEGSC